MKKTLLIFCAVILLFSLCACAKQTGDTIIDVIGREDGAAENGGASGDKEQDPDDLEQNTADDDGQKDPVVEIPVKNPSQTSEDTQSSGEEQTPPVNTQPFVPIRIDGELPYETDLNGDEINEKIDWELMDFGENTGCYRLVLSFNDIELKANTYISFDASIWLADLDGDGYKEIFLSGDIASDDFITYGFRLRDGQLQPVDFDDAALWPQVETGRGYTYGEILEVREDGLELVETFDVLGSYRGHVYFVPDEDGYVLETEKILFSGNEYVLKTKVNLPFIRQNGDVETADTLAAGQELVITGVDLDQHVYFKTVDGQEGYFTLITGNDGFTYQISGLDEFSCFDFLPYVG